MSRPIQTCFDRLKAHGGGAETPIYVYRRRRSTEYVKRSVSRGAIPLPNGSFDANDGRIWSRCAPIRMQRKLRWQSRYSIIMISFAGLPMRMCIFMAAVRWRCQPGRLLRTYIPREYLFRDRRSRWCGSGILTGRGIVAASLLAGEIEKSTRTTCPQIAGSTKVRR